jgi:hypothetical protein
METYTMGKKLIVDSNDRDFVENPRDFDYIANSIVSALDQRDLFLESRSPGAQPTLL